MTDDVNKVTLRLDADGNATERLQTLRTALTEVDALFDSFQARLDAAAGSTTTFAAHVEVIENALNRLATAAAKEGLKELGGMSGDTGIAYVAMQAQQKQLAAQEDFYAEQDRLKSRADAKRFASIQAAENEQDRAAARDIERQGRLDAQIYTERRTAEAKAQEILEQHERAYQRSMDTIEGKEREALSQEKSIQERGAQELTELRMRNTAKGEAELQRWSEKLDAFTARDVEAQKRGLQEIDQAWTTYANKGVQAAERTAQGTLQANEHMAQQVASSTARMDAVAERSEAVRAQVGAKGGQQRLQRLLETNEQMTQVTKNAESERDRAVQEGETERLHAVAVAAQAMAKTINENAYASVTARRTAEQESLRATESYYASLNNLTAQREAHNTQIIQDAARARNNVGSQISAERAMLATGGGGEGGGGGITGMLGGFMGGFGGLGGIAGGALSAGKGILGGVGNVLGAGFSALGSLGQGALSALMAPLHGIGDAFNGILENVNNATNGVKNFIMVGLGIWGVWEIASLGRRVFDEMAGAIIKTQDVMVKVGSLTSATTGDIREMTAQVLEVSMMTGRSSEELGQAMYFIQSHGVQGAASLRMLADAAKLSAAGLGETNQIVRVVAGQMLAYNEVLDGSAKSLEIVDHYYDVFARTVQISAVPAEEVAQTFARITPLAAALHIPVTELGADFATISQTGLNANRVMTDLIAVFNQFLQGSPKQVEALKSIGLSLAQVRQTLSEHGLIAAAMQIWDAAGRDIAKVGDIFGDRTRALTGLLALVEDGGTRATANLKAMADAGGRMDEVFAASLGRISVQWQRFMRIIEAVGVVVVNFSTNALSSVTERMNDINNALMNADFQQAARQLGMLFQDIGTGIKDTFKYIAEQMFGAGVNIVTELANGIVSAANSVLEAAVNGVADLIAGFLIGHSPPPRGPLSYINEGVARWMKSYGDAMTSNASALTDSATNVAGAVNAELGKIGAINAAGYTSAGVKQTIANLDAQILPWKNAAQDIKDKYDDMLRPLNQQIEAIRAIKDLEYERQQIAFRSRQMEIDRMMLAAEGDLRKRAALEGQQARQQWQSERDSLTREQLSLNRQMREMRPGRGVSSAEYAAERRVLADQIAANKTRLDIINLTNPQLLGQATAAKKLLDYDERGAKLADDAFKLQQQITLQPLIDQHDKIIAQQKVELDQINDHVRVLEQERAKWQAIEQQINAAKAAAAGTKGNDSWIQEAYDKEGGMFGGITKQVQDTATKIAANFRAGFENYMSANSTVIGRTVMGFIGGGLIGGIPGAFAGATLLPKIIEALEDRDVTADDWKKFVTRAQASLVTAWGKAQQHLQAGDVLGAAESFAESVSDWLKDVDKALFNVWTTSRIPGIKGQITADTQSTLQNYAGGGAEGQKFIEANIGAAGTQRQTGLGRTIIEAMFGQQDADLNYKTAYALLDKNVFQPVLKVITDWWDKFTMPKVLDVNEPGKKGPSNMEQLGRGILSAITSAFKWVGENLGPVSETLGTTLGNAFTEAVKFMAKDKQMQDLLGTAVETLGEQLAGRFMKGLFSGPAAAIAENPPKLGGPVQTGFDAAGFAKNLFNKPGETGAAALAAGKDMLMASPFAAPAMLLFAGFEWVKLNIPETLSAINDLLKTKGDEFQGTVKSAWDIIQKVYEAAWNVLVKITQTKLAEINLQLKNYGYLFGLEFKVIVDVIETATEPWTTLSTLILDGVKAWGEDALWKPLLDKLDKFKLALSDPEMAKLIRTLGNVPTPAPATPTPAQAPKPNYNLAAPSSEPGFASGADFIVGPRGTDTEYRSMWLTPGERVTVTPSGAAGGTDNGGVTINGPLIHVENMHANDEAQIDVLLDRVRRYLVNDIRTARGQGVKRPLGYTPSGARG